MARHCFEVVLHGISPNAVVNNLPSSGYSIDARVSATGVSMVLWVDSDDDEDTVFNAIKAVIPPPAELRRTVRPTQTMSAQSKIVPDLQKRRQGLAADDNIVAPKGGKP